MTRAHSSPRIVALSALALLGAALATPLATPAAAGELDVRVQAVDKPARAMTWLDVGPGPMPGLRFRSVDGTPHRLEIELSQGAGERVELRTRVLRVQVKRNGTERVSLVNDAVLETTDGDPATLEMTLPNKAGRVRIELVPRLSAEKNRPPMIERSAAPPPAAPEPPSEPEPEPEPSVGE